jgi:diacylglycerol kinase (ATP)
MRFIRSFYYAWQGIRYCFNTQFNFRFQVFAAFGAVLASMLLRISRTEWLFVIGSSMLVLVLELLNTAIEWLCNRVTTEIDPSIKIIKDSSAAAVLVAAGSSFITGMIIFLPRLIALF